MVEEMESYNASLHLNPLGNLHIELEVDPPSQELDDFLVLHRGVCV